MEDFNIKNVSIETKTFLESKPVEYVYLRTEMSKAEFYKFVELLRDASKMADSESWDEYSDARKEFEENENDATAAWRKDYWLKKWSVMSDLSRLIKDWLDEHEKWNPEHEEEHDEED